MLCFFYNEAVLKMIINGRSPTMRHVSRTDRVALDRSFDRINLDPQIQIKYVDTKNQLADMLTNGSFYRWWMGTSSSIVEHYEFLDAFLQPFLSNRKQSVVSKRAQESTAKEGSAVAKPRPMSLVSRNLLSAMKTPPQDASASHSPGNQELDQSCVSSSVRKLVRQQCILKRGNKMTLNLPAPGNWSGEMNLQTQPAPGNWSEVRISDSEGESYTSTICRSLSSVPWESLQERAAKVESRRRRTSTWYRRVEDQRIDLGTTYVDDDVSCCASCTKLHWNFGSFRKHELRGTSEFIWYHAEIDIGSSSRNYECISDCLDSSLMVEIYAYAPLCLEKMQEHSEANQRWKHQLEECGQSSSYRALFGMMENRLSSSVHWRSLLTRPKKLARSKHWTWEYWRTDHLHDNVQWHRLDVIEEIQKDVFRIRTSQELREEILARTLDILRPRRWKEMERNSPLHTWRKMGFHRHRDGGTFQRNWSPSIQEHQCFESWNSEEKRWQRYHTLQCGFIEHRTTCCFAQFSQQISSVYMEQFQASVKSSLNGLRIQTSRLRRSSWQKKMSNYWKMWSRKKWILCCKLQGAIIGHLETDCGNVFRDLKHCRKISTLREFVKMRHSWEASLLGLLGWATKLFLT